MADVLLVSIVLFLGVLIRFLVPYLLKVYDKQISFKEIDWRYIVSAAITFFVGLGLQIILDIASLPEPNVYIYALFFGIGGHELANNVLKAIEYTRKTRTPTPI